MISKVGIPVVDSHAHFITYDTMTRWLNSGVSLDRLKQRIQHQTDMGSKFEIPTERWDTGQMWVNELDKYGITGIGMMIGPEERQEFLETQQRFPGRFLGYANVDPAQSDAVDRVRKAGRDNFQGIKLYPSQWNFPIYDPRVYPILEEVKKQKLLVILHFGITIGLSANLRFGNPLDIQKVAQDFPDLNFMIAHFGAGFFREMLMLMYQVPNVLMDTSGSNSWMKYLPYDLTLKKVFEKAIAAAGACRIVFGTDSSFFPRGFRYNLLEDQYNAVQSLRSKLNLTDEDVQLVFRDNILRLTGFEPALK